MLTDKGFSCDQPLQEDYGWGFYLQAGGMPIWVCCALVSEGDYQG